MTLASPTTLETETARAGSVQRLVSAHIVALSGGKDSTAMALRLAETDPETDYEYCITPTGRELPPMVNHWKKLECLLGKPLVRIPAPTLVELIVKYGALPNWRMRWCTRQIKIEPFQLYALTKTPSVCYVGIRADEADAREGTDHTGIEGVTQACPMVGWGWGINDVLGYLRSRDAMPPPRTDCDWCFFQRLEEWWLLWRDWPQQWMEGEAMEKLTGHTFRSDGRDSWPASMEGLRKMFEAGYVPKGAAQEKLPLDISERPTMCAWCAR